MPVAAQSFIHVMESVRNRDLPLSSPVLVEVGQGTQSQESRRQVMASRTRTTSERDMWFLSYASEYGRNRSFVLSVDQSSTQTPTKTLTIGRSRSCDMRIAHKSVSSLHARLRFDFAAQRYLLADEGSRNGTLVSGERILPGVETQIWSGAMLSFGQTAYIFLLAATIRKLVQLSGAPTKVE